MFIVDGLTEDESNIILRRRKVVDKRRSVFQTLPRVVQGYCIIIESMSESVYVAR